LLKTLKAQSKGWKAWNEGSCLQTRAGKTLNALSGVDYTDLQRDFRSSIVPKLYRVGGFGNRSEECPGRNEQDKNWDQETYEREQSNIHPGLRNPAAEGEFHLWESTLLTSLSVFLRIFVQSMKVN